MRKGDDGEKNGKKNGEKKEKKKKIMMKIVATNVVASRPPNGDRLQRRPLVPIIHITTSPIRGHQHTFLDRSGWTTGIVIIKLPQSS